MAPAASLLPPPPNFASVSSTGTSQERAFSLRFYLKLGSSEAGLGRGFEGRGYVCLGASSGQLESGSEKGRASIACDEQVCIVGTVVQSMPAVGGKVKCAAQWPDAHSHV